MKQLLAATAVALTLGACASAPKRVPPEIDVTVPADWTAAKATGTDAVSANWWTSFGDTSLDHVITEALDSNLDIESAAARVRQASAMATISGADLLPDLNASASASRQQQVYVGLPIPGTSVLTSRSNSFGVSLNTAWELDLFGANRKATSAANADAQAATATLAAVRLSVAAQTARTWFAAVELTQQVELAHETVASYEASAERVRRRYEEGVVTALDYRLALSSLAGARASLERQQQARDAVVRQLEVMLGRYPGAALATGEALPRIDGDVPAGLPSTLLARRPDLVAAERRFAAAEARVSQSRRAFFPRISLTGSAGTLSDQLDDLTNLDFGVWRIAAGIVQPIFQGGKLVGNLKRAHGASDEALFTYVSSLLRAFGEVETSIVADHSLVEQERHMREAAQQAEAAHTLAERQYDAGVIDYITLLEAQRQSLAARSQLLATQRARLDARVDLYLALGGGFDATTDWASFLQSSPAPNGGQR